MIEIWRVEYKWIQQEHHLASLYFYVIYMNIYIYKYIYASDVISFQNSNHLQLWIALRDQHFRILMIIRKPIRAYLTRLLSPDFRCLTKSWRVWVLQRPKSFGSNIQRENCTDHPNHFYQYLCGALITPSESCHTFQFQSC